MEPSEPTGGMSEARNCLQGAPASEGTERYKAEGQPRCTTGAAVCIQLPFKPDGEHAVCTEKDEQASVLCAEESEAPCATRKPPIPGGLHQG
jgi:hypothetical protein